MKYLALVVRGWDTFVPAPDSYSPVTVQIDARPTVAFAPIYDSLEDLEKDCPGAQWIEIRAVAHARQEG